MHFPQVRSFRHHADARFAVRAAAEHSQRKDLHIHMVLVPDTAVLAGPDVRPQVRMRHEPIRITIDTARVRGLLNSSGNRNRVGS